MPDERVSSGALQIGLLDPLPFVHRSVNLVLLPLADRAGLGPAPLPRFYEGAGLIGALFLSALLLNLWVPRFYCRFVCPLGAIWSPFNRISLMRLSAQGPCAECQMCVDVCPVDIRISDDPNSPDCIRCLKCTVCKHVSVQWSYVDDIRATTVPTVSAKSRQGH